MQSDDTFLTIASETEGIYKEKGSKFLSFAYPVRSEEDVKEKVDGLRRKYFDARHHCYAYRLGPDGERYRANDDGEPNNSAGKPILGRIVSYDLTNVLVVVVRYFGGILLGTGGLTQAYKQATADALSRAEIIRDTITETYRLCFEYPDMSKILKEVKDMNLRCYDRDFGQTCRMRVEVRKSLSSQLKRRLETIESLKIESE